MSAAGALRRSWKPVGRMVVLHLQRAAAPCGHRGLSTAFGSSSSSWLCHVTVENNIIRGSSSSGVWEKWTMSFASSPHVRFASSKSGTLEEKDEESGHLEKDRELREELRREIEDDMRKEAEQNMVDSNYWGVTSKSYFREDGTKWPWNCFKPGETYAPDVKIDLHKHRVPVAWEEKIALWAVKTIKIPVNLFYRKRYGCRAMMLETVAAVPGMVGGMLLHLRSLRRFEHSGGWIKALLDEAENERMHLMTLMDVVQPVWYERYLVVIVQGIFFNFYFMLYVLSPRLAHRITGYLEEEAIISYTTFLEELDRGVVENVPAPPIAIDYWRLPKDAKFRDVILALRADEAHHRDVNHYAADIRTEGKQLHESPAPVDYR